MRCRRSYKQGMAPCPDVPTRCTSAPRPTCYTRDVWCAATSERTEVPNMEAVILKNGVVDYYAVLQV